MTTDSSKESLTLIPPVENRQTVGGYLRSKQKKSLLSFDKLPKRLPLAFLKDQYKEIMAGDQNIKEEEEDSLPVIQETSSIEVKVEDNDDIKSNELIDINP